jgi:hypothetical protein
MAGSVDQLIFTFNKFFYDLVKDLKTSTPSLSAQIKKNYSLRERETRDHFNLIADGMTEDIIKCLVSSPVDQLFTFGQVTKVHILLDLDINDILLQIPVDFKEPFLGYLYLFAILILVERTQSNLFLPVMYTINAIQKGEAFEKPMEDILDDDICALLKHFHVVSKAPAAAPAPTDKMENIIGNSQIGSIAKEIASSIDLSSINPENMLSGSNCNMIGDLVSKVGVKLQEKFNDGSMKQEDLVKEAMSMMSMMGGGGGGAGGFMSELFKTFGGAGAPANGARRHKKKLTKS